MKTVGIVISTPGRQSLARTLLSIKYQSEGIEDVLVVGDGFHAPTRELVEWFAQSGLRCRYQATVKTRDWGHTQMNYGLQHVKGDFVTYQDDDDIYLPRALEEMVRLVNAMEEPVPLLGRVKTPKLGVLWQRPNVTTCLDGHCLVAPNDKRKLGWMAPYHHGDQGWLQTTLRNYEKWQWTDRLWTLTRPEGELDVWSCTRGDGSWTFHFGDSAPAARLTMVKDPDNDRFIATLDWWRAGLSHESFVQIVQYAVYACQSNDCWFRFERNPRLVAALREAHYKEHTPTEYTHDWPPDFWPDVAPFDHTVNPDTGEKLSDWRDDIWGGRAVT